MKSGLIRARAAEKRHAFVIRMHGHQSHVHFDVEDHRVFERASAVATLCQPAQDVEKELMKRKIAELEAAVGNIGKYLHTLSVQQAPNVSYLDEVLAALEAKRDQLPEAKLPQSFIDSLSSDDV